MSRAADVTSALDARLVGDSEISVGLDLTLRYFVDDPYAVTAVFQPDGAVTEWVLDRETLASGLAGFAGMGDVTVRPVPGRARVMLRLTSPDGTGLVELPSAEVRAFLAATEKLVPYGSESMDLDGLVGHLLGVS